MKVGEEISCSMIQRQQFGSLTFNNPFVHITWLKVQTWWLYFWHCFFLFLSQGITYFLWSCSPVLSVVINGFFSSFCIELSNGWTNKIRERVREYYNSLSLFTLLVFFLSLSLSQVFVSRKEEMFFSVRWSSCQLICSKKSTLKIRKVGPK